MIDGTALAWFLGAAIIAGAGLMLAGFGVRRLWRAWRCNCDHETWRYSADPDCRVHGEYA